MKGDRHIRHGHDVKMQVVSKCVAPFAIAISRRKGVDKSKYINPKISTLNYQCILFKSNIKIPRVQFCLFYMESTFEL